MKENKLSFTHYKSKVTGKIYDRSEYVNHGYGGVKNGFKDLPHDEYPYECIIIEANEKI